MILSASNKHIPDIVRIHCASLPDDFLPRLGSDFLEETFYPAVIRSQKAELLIEIGQDDRVDGFIVITLDSGRFLSDIISNNFWRFLITGLKNSLTSIKSMKNNVEILIASLFSKEKDEAGEIYVIAVDLEMRGQGIGAKLVEAAQHYLLENGIPAIKIKTLSSNSDWIKHFERSGWKHADMFKLIGNEYVVMKTVLE